MFLFNLITDIKFKDTFSVEAAGLLLFFFGGSSTFLFLFSTTGTAMALFRNSSRSFKRAEFILLILLVSEKEEGFIR